MYERVGGAPWFEALTVRFYDAVAEDPVLRPLYPDDLTEGREHLCGFLIQYWGGPTDYSDQRGHPRLRMRHAPFAIGEAERNAWFRHMSDAVIAAGTVIYLNTDQSDSTGYSPFGAIGAEYEVLCLRVAIR